MTSEKTIVFDGQKLRLSYKRGTLELAAWPKPEAVVQLADWIWGQTCAPDTMITPSTGIRGNVEGVFTRRTLEFSVKVQTVPLTWEVPLTRRAEHLSRPFFDFIKQIPADVRSLLARYPHGHWMLLRHAARCRDFIELMRANPALAFGLAMNEYLRRAPVKDPFLTVRWLLREKQREMLAWLGFPDTEAAVHVLRKLSLEECDISTLKSVRSQLRNPEVVKMLSHLQRINTSAWFLVEKPELARWVSPSFIRDALSRVLPPFRKDLDTILPDTMNMWLLVRPGARPIRFRSLEHLFQLHDQLVEECRKLEEGKFQQMTFPAPPFPGTPTVVPLDTPALLLEETIEQHNCVVSYARMVGHGEYYIYRVLEPERATVAVVFRRGHWIIGELSAACNRPVKEETRKVVKEWFVAQKAAASTGSEEN